MGSKFKVRRPLLEMSSASFVGSVSFGTSGTAISSIYCGSATAEVPAVTASNLAVSGCITATGVPLGAKCFVQILSASKGVCVVSACVKSAGLIECNYGVIDMHATGACTFSVQYLAVA